MSDYTILVAVQLIRTVLGPDVSVQEIRSRRSHIPDAQREPWEAFAGGPIVAGHAKAALLIPATLAAKPLPSTDLELSAYFRSILDRAAPDVSALSWVDKVRTTIERRLSDGTPSADAVGRELGVGARSLARRLKEEGETFGALLSAVRQERARTLLADANVTQAEVAFLLGYRDQASFHRAFRRWFGTTPAIYRRKLE